MGRATLALWLVLIAHAQAQEICAGVITDTVFDNVEVPSGTCRIQSTVTGNIIVFPGAKLVMEMGASVGSVEMLGDSTIFVKDASVDSIKAEDGGADVRLLDGSSTSVNEIKCKGCEKVVVKGCVNTVSHLDAAGELTVNGAGFCDAANLGTCACEAPPAINVEKGTTTEKYVLKNWLIPDAATSANDVGIKESTVSGSSGILIKDYALGDLNLEKNSCVDSGSIEIKGSGTALQSDATISENTDCGLIMKNGVDFSSDVSITNVPTVTISKIHVETIELKNIDTLSISDSVFNSLNIVEIDTVDLDDLCIEEKLIVEKSSTVAIDGTTVADSLATAEVKCVDNGSLGGSGNEVAGTNECAAIFATDSAASC